LETLHRFLLATEVTADGRAIALDEGLDRAVTALPAAGGGGKAMVVGNGGSAAIAAHLQVDLVHTLGVRALEFTAAPLLTAISNDRSYAEAFPSLVAFWATAGDLLIAISSSGRSPNIVEAARAARAKGAKVVTFSGFAPENPLRSLGDVNLYVPAEEYGLVESAHAVLAHCLVDRAAEIRGPNR
jgi:D-sedoheptulose 7-phosphate isomerase